VTTTLRVILSEMSSPSAGLARYSEELARELVRTAPPGCEVEGVVAAVSDDAHRSIEERVPGLAGLHRSALARRELQLAWQHGITRLPGKGMVHAPSLLAPLFRHDREQNPGDQTVVTVHGLRAWVDPSAVDPRTASWQRGMLRRAYRYADAIVVPTHTVAADLAAIADVGDRVRVIPPGVSAKLLPPVDADERAVRLGLPSDFVLAPGLVAPHRGLESAIRSLAGGDDAGLPLLVAGERPAWSDLDIEAVAREAGVEDRVRVLGPLSDADLAVALQRATVVVLLADAAGTGLGLLEALASGTPVVHSDAPEVLEISAGAGLPVPLHGGPEDEDGVASAISSVVSDEALAGRLGVLGRDRARAFSWRDTAQRVWQLHADL